MAGREKVALNSKFTQGTIIEDIRSDKYPEIRCKGIVISARCDLANDKLKQFHCLTALTLENWVYEVLFGAIVDELKKNVLGTIRKYCVAKELDFDTILEFGDSQAEEVLIKSAASKEIKQIELQISLWRKYSKLCESEVSREDKKKFLVREGKKQLKSKLHQLYNSAYPKYAFIPEKAFTKSCSSVNGIVVDLHDVKQIDIAHRDNILAYKYDYSIMKDVKERRVVNLSFFLNNENDFVIADSIIKSPWVEYVLQLFANSFTRIGVDNALDGEIEEYCEQLLKEKEE